MFYREPNRTESLQTAEHIRANADSPVMVMLVDSPPSLGVNCVTPAVESSFHSNPHEVIVSLSKSPAHLDGMSLMKTCTWVWMRAGRVGVELGGGGLEKYGKNRTFFHTIQSCVHKNRQEWRKLI